ncbi:hypothetical protein [Sphingomonas profundi]|uniref:hypothetical protein n=1 Tax=Alterirhizorhabdus profundi TaxID=2681549 RepID=UPI0012E96BFA|nr:hypothetical protein [Sphingomonas profundi]
MKRATSSAGGRDHTDGLTKGLIPHQARGYCCTSIYAYGYEERAACGALLNADGFNVAEQELRDGAEVTAFVYFCKSCGEEVLIVRGDRDCGHASLFAFEHAPGSEWMHTAVPAAIAEAHAAIAGDSIGIPAGVAVRCCEAEA